jgi:hypothetical protein
VALNAFHDSGRVTAAVGRQHGIAASTLDQRGEVGLTVMQPERDEVAFPTPEVGPLSDVWRARGDGMGGWNVQAARLASVAKLAFPPAGGQ